MSEFKQSFPDHIVKHCIEALERRYNVKRPFVAEQMYFRHHGMIVQGTSKPLYHKYLPDRDFHVSTTHMITTQGGIFYPVRCYNTQRDSDITVTYLSPEQVLNNLIHIHVTKTSAPVFGLYAIDNKPDLVDNDISSHDG